jgi:hypothetical protein
MECDNSYDSTAWTFPRIAGNPSCKNFIQCVQYYYDYLIALKVFKYSLTCFDVVQTRLGVKV